MVTFKDAGSSVTKQVEYSYDALNRKISRSVDLDGDGSAAATTEHYIHDPSWTYGPQVEAGETSQQPLDHEALVVDDTGAVLERHLHGPQVDQWLAQETAGVGTLWLLADHLGTIRQMLAYDSGSDITSTYRVLIYDAFGNPRTLSDPNLIVPRFGFTGREWDSNTGLYHYRARWYDAGAGRFISSDPIGFEANDRNVSRYVSNSPLSYTDPSGEMTLGSLLAPVGGTWGFGSVMAGYTGVFYALGENPLHGAYYSVQIAIGGIIVPPQYRKEIVAMGVISAFFEILVQRLYYGSDARKTVAEGLKAFSDGVFDAAVDKWATMAEPVYPPGRTFRWSDYPVDKKLAVERMGGLSPFLVIVRAITLERLEGKEVADANVLVAAMVEGLLTWFTNESGFDLSKKLSSTRFNLPSSVRKFIANEGTGAMTRMIVKAGGPEQAAKKLIQIVSSGVSRLFEGLGEWWAGKENEER